MKLVKEVEENDKMSEQTWYHGLETFYHDNLNSFYFPVVQTPNNSLASFHLNYF